MLRTLARPITRLMVRSKPIRDLMIRYYDRKTDTGSGGTGWTKPHPVDAQYGIKTGGLIPGYILQGGSPQAVSASSYAGSQPSIVRRSLALVPRPEETTLLELGCGKGRVLAIASEFPFREIVGVELSDTVAVIAEANMVIVREKFPGRPPIRVAVGDAIEYPLPAGRLAIFLYNSFGEPGVARLLARIEAALRASDDPITVVYLNPVCGELLDRSPLLARTHALTLAYDASELGYGPDESDAVIVWQDRRQIAGEPPSDVHKRIVVAKGGSHVELASAQ